MQADRAFLSARLGLFYAAYFLAVGIYMPFWPVWLQSRGLSAENIGVILAAGLAMRVVVNPLIAQTADRLGERRRVIITAALAATASFALFGTAHGFWSILLISLLYFSFWPALNPLSESLTMLMARRHDLDYGRIRLWGSLSFILAAVVAGWVLTGRPLNLVYWMILGVLGLTVCASLLLPDARTPARVAPRFGMLQVVRNPRFLHLLAVTALIQSSHAVYYGYASLHWRTVGYSANVIGLLWAEGVIAEVVLFMFGAALVGRLGPVRLIALGGLAGLIRWTVLGTSDALPALVAVQCLHAFTYGATHLGAIHFISRTIPGSLSSTAQSLYSAAVMGLGMGLTTLVAGRLYESYASGAYLAMAAMAAGGLLLALWLVRRADGDRVGDGS